MINVRPGRVIVKLDFSINLLLWENIKGTARFYVLIRLKYLYQQFICVHMHCEGI